MTPRQTLFVRLLLAFAAIVVCWSCFGATVNWTNDPMPTISGGDTLNVWGTHTNFVVSASGTAGSPTLIAFQSGAKVSMGALPVGWNLSGGIKVSANYVTVDGAFVECTSNGTALLYQSNSVGIQLSPTFGNITIQNCTITNIYQRTAGSADAPSGGAGYGIAMAYHAGVSNIMVTNCNISWAYQGVALIYGATNSNFAVLNSHFWHINHGVVFGDANAGCGLSNAICGSCTMDSFHDFDGYSGNHHNGFFAYEDGSGSTLVGVSVTNCVIGPNFGVDTNTTSGIFYECLNTGSSNCLIANNLIYWSNTSYGANHIGPNDAAIYPKGLTLSGILNNTVYDPTGNYAAVRPDMTTTTLVYSNNIFAGVGKFFDCETDTVELPQSSDYNCFYGSGNWRNGGTYYNWATWQALGYDAHSITNNPLFVSAGTDFHLQAGSPAIGAGLGGVDMGAFAYSAPAGLTINCGTLHIGP